MSAAEVWGREEVEVIVADYLHMLTQELAGQSYSKTTHRRVLSSRLQDRSDGSIERKHQNISAILIELGCPYISGYKPLRNYQAMLHEVVAARVALDALFDRAALRAAEQPAAAPLAANLRAMLEEAPALRAAQPEPQYRVRQIGLRRDYLEREARNRSLGAAGEELALAYERFRLHVAGQSHLGDRVEHVSRTRGDGLGFDILSFEVSGRERYIEVKTTAFGKETPFFISRNEVDLSAAAGEQFHLYRLFEFRRQPRLFTLAGQVQDRCILDPATFVARFG